MERYNTLNEQVDRLKTLMNIKESPADQLTGELAEADINEWFGGDFARTLATLSKRLLGIRSPEEKKAAVSQFIQSGAHPMMTAVYNKYKDTDPLKAEKYIEFYAQHPDDFPKWDASKMIFTPTGSVQQLHEKDKI
jgi:hypothetical protein